jgi:hypothetical protein
MRNVGVKSMAVEAARWIREQGVADVDIVGHNMDGLIALLLAHAEARHGLRGHRTYA